MTRAWRAAVAFSVLISLSHWFGMPRDIAEWQMALKWLPGVIADPLATVLPPTLIVVQIAAAMIVLLLVGGVARRLAQRMRLWGILFGLRIKGVLKMAEWLTEKEALAVIGESDFIALRQPHRLRLPRDLTAMLGGGAARQEIPERNYIRAVLLKFAERFPDDVSEEGYRAQALSRWLDNMVFKEAEAALGPIPDV